MIFYKIMKSILLSFIVQNDVNLGGDHLTSMKL
jgi:hypothetical protein